MMGTAATGCICRVILVKLLAWDCRIVGNLVIVIIEFIQDNQPFLSRMHLASVAMKQGVNKGNC